MEPIRRFPLFSLALALGVAAAGACSDAAPATGALEDAAVVDGAAGDAGACAATADSLVRDVFAASCATSGCHDASGTSASLALASVADVLSLAGRRASECGGATLVVSGDPDGSYLLNKIAGDTPTCGDPMPLGGARLSPASVACVRGWIASLATASDDGGAASDGAALDSGPACAAPTVPCGATCVNTQNDPANCGGCGKTCPVACSEGACVAQCPNGTKSCNGACVNTQVDAANCGACGVVCSAGKTCSAGACTCGPTVSFAGTLQPILTANCAVNGCHTGNRPASSLDLGAGKAYASLVGVGSSTCGGRTRVAAGNVAGSYLINKLTGVDLCAGTQMPKAGASLPAAQIDAFKGWICNGATNN